MKQKMIKKRKEKLEIMQVGGLGLPIRNDLKYAGTERVISYLDKEYIKRGHSSIIAASGDSDVAGRLYATIPRSLWVSKNDAGSRNILSGNLAYIIHYNKVIDFLINEKVDIVHDHPGNGFVHSDEYMDRAKKIKDIPILTTQHGKYFPEYREKYNRWAKLIKEGYPLYFNAISYSQKKEFENNTGVEIKDVIYHGIPLDLFPFNSKPQDYLFSLGRICNDKGQHIAIDVAKKTGRPLYIGGEVHSVDQDYFNRKIKPFLDFSIFNVSEKFREEYKNELISKIDSGEKTIKEGQIHYIGGLDDKQKAKLYKNSSAFLMPIRWPEPFGLVMIESMATGSPVIAFNYGSVEEVVEHEKSGFVIDNSAICKKNMKPSLDLMVKEMSSAVDNLGKISRENCRKRVEDYFNVEKEAESYLKLYNELI